MEIVSVHTIQFCIQLFGDQLGKLWLQLYRAIYRSDSSV